MAINEGVEDKKTQRKVVSLGSEIDSPKNIKKMGEVRLLSESELDERKIIYQQMQNRTILNVFRELRTSLMQRFDKSNFVCMVSSFTKDGGGSFVAANLAAAIAFDHNKTAVLVDCNLYDPSVEKILTSDPEYGLTDYLEDSDVGVEDVIHASGIKRLRVVPIGTHTEGGGEYFSSPRMYQFVDSIKSRYSDRFVILDAPPIDSFADAKILSDMCDCVVLVAPYGKVVQEQIQAGVDAISEKKLAGVVFNY